jgi:tol-pal system protein YbgF
VLSGCATDVVSRTEHSEVLSSVRALRAENARLEARLEKLEAQQLVASARAASATRPAVSAAKPSSSSNTSSDALPPLAVVKLKPRKESAPKVDTAVEIAEPPEALTQEFQNEATVGPAVEDNAPTAADAQFERALSQMKTGNSEAGVAQMAQFVADWPKHPRADNALYLSGMAYVADRDFARATEFFERVVAQFPAGDAVVDSMLRLADCRLRLNHPREARATWEKIVSSFPGTAAATQAQARLASSTQVPVGSP